jgi:hypothetical protein
VQFWQIFQISLVVLIINCTYSFQCDYLYKYRNQTKVVPYYFGTFEARNRKGFTIHIWRDPLPIQNNTPWIRVACKRAVHEALKTGSFLTMRLRDQSPSSTRGAPPPPPHSTILIRPQSKSGKYKQNIGRKT